MPRSSRNPGRPVGSHPAPRHCSCSFSTCRHDFELYQALEVDWPFYTVPNAAGHMIRIQATSEAGAKFLALNHITHNLPRP